MGIIMGVLIGLTFVGSVLTAVPTLAVEWARRDAPEVLFYAATSQPVVALTIDDGPSEATAEILDVLAEHGAHATFFVIGDHVRSFPELTRRIRAEGHELAHHMMADERSIDLPPEVFRDQFAEMDGVLVEFGGSPLFRPGSGWYDDEMIESVERAGYRTVLGSVYPFDAHLPSAALASWYVVNHVHPGAILILHDGPERGVRTADALRRILPELGGRGIRVVQVSELLESVGKAGVAVPAGSGGAAGEG